MRGFDRYKPTPHAWTVTKHGIVPHYDFQFYKKSNPPPLNHETTITYIHCGEFTKHGAWVSK